MAATRVCALADLTVNEPKKVMVDGAPIALVRDESDTVFALGDTCSHGEISLSEGFVEDGTLECWAHGSKFSLVTGQPVTLPAFQPVPVYAVQVIAGEVHVDLTVTVSAVSE